jgi:hypothetical protein
MGFFGKPKSGPPPTLRPTPSLDPGPSTSNSSPTSTLRTPSSAAGSSPNINTGSRKDVRDQRGGSPLKRSTLPTAEDSDDDLSPPAQASTRRFLSSNVGMNKDTEMAEMFEEDVAIGATADGSPIVVGWSPRSRAQG